MKREQVNAKFGVTDAQLDKWAQEYEDDSWSGKLGKVIQGRPSIANEEVKPVTVRLPVSKIIALDNKAMAHNSTRSAELREAIDEYLMQA
jgi:transposase